MSSSLLFLGTGSSTGTPNPFFLMKSPEHFVGDEDRYKGCLVSRKAVIGDPAHNKDYRCNPSMLIRYRNCESDEVNILIDCGKTFREAAIRWFPRNSVESVDAVLLSHGHADAIFGLDDLRGVQDRTIMTPIPIFLSSECMEVITKTLGYLIPKPASDDSPTRTVASLKWNVIEPYVPLNVLGLNIIPIPVMHGEDMTSLGFIFGEKDRIVYISDISRILPESLHLIKQKEVSILIVDALFLRRTYFSHFNLPQALEFCRLIGAAKTLFVGMSSEFDHEEVNMELKSLFTSEGLDVQLSCDGQVIDVDL
jgi:phosphoribosyl 1,2-cyclic phosphodiesterase